MTSTTLPLWIGKVDAYKRSAITYLKGIGITSPPDEAVLRVTIRFMNQAGYTDSLGLELTVDDIKPLMSFT